MEIAPDEALARRLIAAQFPQWAGLSLAPVPSAGTDNAIYRLGHDKVIRLPRLEYADAQIEKEHACLPRLGPLPLAIPRPLTPAWAWLPAEARRPFRDAIGPDEAAWARGRGWAFSIAVVTLASYLDRNPGLVRAARRTFAAVLEDR